jgi:FkbM family methyltransferase
MIQNLIYDIGFHIGQDTQFYLEKGFHVVGIDANPILIENGKIKFSKYIDENKLILINSGVSDETSELPFYVNANLSEWSSFDKSIGTSRGNYETISVKVIPLKEIILKYGVPYYLKIDIEGYDFKAVYSIRDLQEKPKYISVENGQKYIIDELLHQGYRRFKFVNQALIQNCKLTQPSKEGLYVDYNFSVGCSGPFGDDINQDWVSYEEVVEKSEAYWNKIDRDDSIDGWFDLHASL